jgi:hypothetical protein
VTDEYHDLMESDDCVVLDYAPVISVTSASVNRAAYGDAKNWATVTANSRYLYPKRGMLYLYNQTFLVTEQNVKVTYKAGYAAAPRDIEFACEQLCANVLHDSLQRKVSPVVRVDDWSVRVIVPEVFTKELKEMLSRYRRRSVDVG